VISYAVGPLALMSLRQLLPDQARPFRLPAVKTMTFSAFYVCNLIAYWTGWNTIKCVLIAVVVGYVWLAFYKNTKHGRELHLAWTSAAWLMPYFIGLGVISYLGSFGGGKEIIAFGWDFLVIALFSICCFVLAIRSCNDQAVLQKTLLYEAL
jgi:amino acid transporter